MQITTICIANQSCFEPLNRDRWQYHQTYEVGRRENPMGQGQRVL